MNNYYLELAFDVSSGSGVPAHDLDGHLDDLMEALTDEPGATDADISAELSTGRVTINMYVDAKDDGDAVNQALLVARSAIHKAGGFTGGWLSSTTPGEMTVADTYNVRVQRAELVDC